MKTLPHTKSCFVCGDSNPLGLQLKFQSDGRLVRTVFTPRQEHIGFKHVVHGGILATLLDEIMVWACVASTRRVAYCAELTVRFQKPARPDAPLTVEAELVTNRRNKIFEARAWVRDADGALLSEATGKYLPVSDSEAQVMMTDLLGPMPDFHVT
jgi:uncharacterized protein (TIGR00369 family)